MRIAYVTETYPPEINGVALTVARTVGFLRDRGHEVDLIRPRQAHEPSLDTSREWRTAGWPLPMYPDLRFGWASVGKLRQRFAKQRPSLVHLATPGPLAWSAMRAAHSLGIPTTTDFRTNFHVYSRYYRLAWLSPLILKALRSFHNRSQCTFVPTAQVRQQLLQEGFGPILVAGRGVDTQRFSPSHRNSALRQQLLQSEAPLLLYVGRLAAEKNVRLALEAYEAVRAGTPDARMVVVGDGPQRDQLQRRYPHVHFVGNQTGSNLAEYYASADLFLFPSQTDTYGNVVPEALASGLPVLAFDTGAASELVKNSGAGRLITSGDEERFVTAACAMAWQFRHAHRMRDRARSVALTAQWDRVLAQFEQSLMEMAYVVQTPDAARQARSA